VHVQRVAMPTSGVESWTVLGDDNTPIEPIERYLAYLTDIERPPNTIKAYAHDLKDYWEFLTGRGRDWRKVRLEDIGEYVAWLRLPPTGREGQVAVLPSVRRLRLPRTRRGPTRRRRRARSARARG
jgi:integrase/recombinase XerD